MNVDKFIGIPFVDRGRDLKGCDCWGLVRLVYAGMGYDLPDFPLSCAQTGRIAFELAKRMRTEDQEWAKISEPEVPCVVVMRTDAGNDKLCNHIGVYVGNDFFLHTIQKSNSILTSVHHLYWKNRIVGYWKWAGIKNQ